MGDGLGGFEGLLREDGVSLLYVGDERDEVGKRTFAELDFALVWRLVQPAGAIWRSDLIGVGF